MPVFNQRQTPAGIVFKFNGYAEFQAIKGQFVRLGSLEYLLRASNVIQSGVGGNINNIIYLFAPKKTGRFEVLPGKVAVKDATLNRRYYVLGAILASLSGEIDMRTNLRNLQLLGRLSKKIAGLLGPVGSISLNQFIDYIPGLGFLPASPDKKGIIDLIPGLNKIPGLELGNNSEFRRFAVQIKGDLYKQESVRSFRWIE